MKQVSARKLTDSFAGFLLGTRYLLVDRDTRFCAAFRSMLQEAGVAADQVPARSPNLNAHMERFRRVLEEESLGQVILFGERSVNQFVVHYHRERNHQGLANHLIEADAEVGRTAGDVRCPERLGGLLRYYYREAAEASFIAATQPPSLDATAHPNHCTRGQPPAPGARGSGVRPGETSADRLKPRPSESLAFIRVS